MRLPRCHRLDWLCVLALLISPPLPGWSAEPSASPLGREWFKPLTWRCIGPANMGGRITALSVYEADPTTYFVATASGGLLKTTNNGITFEHLFDREATVSIGDVCVAPSNRDIVWVGTGEANPRNSVSYGDGVYKSMDGGKTWKNCGLKKTFQIGRILIHPKDPDIVYVGALGRLYGPNEERGLYKTTDGGDTWQKILFVDEKTGVIDMRMNPADPETLLVATYERQRDIYDSNDPAKKIGPGSGLYKTRDGGQTFRKVTQGLPTGLLGRIGIDWYRKDPGTVFAIVESEKIGGGPRRIAAPAYLGVEGEDAPGGARLVRVDPDGPAGAAGLTRDDLIVAIDDKPIRSYRALSEVLRSHKAGDKVKVGVRRGQDTRTLDLTFGSRTGTPPGGPLPFSTRLGGQQENIQDRQGPDGFQYGGVFKSTDGGDSWTRINSLNPRPMYFSQVRVDPSDEQNLYVLGVALYRSSDGGKTFRPDGSRGAHADQHALWIDPRDGRHMVLGTDGGFYVTYDRMAHWDHLNFLALGQFYHVTVDPRRDYRVYGGLQDNGSWCGPSLTRSFTGPINEDWININGGDGYTCRVDPTDPDVVYATMQWGGMRRRNLRTGETALIRPSGPRERYRFNWNTPFILSHHNPRIFYCAGNYVFRSLDRGDNLRVISPELPLTKQGTATAVAESPRNPDVLYAGTDDGALWLTRDGGREWKNIVKNVPLPGPRCVAAIEPSRFAEGRAYVVFDGHRSDDDNPYVFVTEDFGQTWKSLPGNLPWGSTRCLSEDIENPDLLYLGTEFGAWCSLDRGQTWNSLNTNLPTVAVHAFAVHPTAGEIVAATHGRSLWVLDVTALRQLTAQARQATARLYKPAPAIRWQIEPARGRTNRRFVGQNPPGGAQVYYSLAKKAEKVSLKVLDIDGKLVRELPVSDEPGLHAAVWNLTYTPQRGGGRSPRGGANAVAAEGRPAASGTYFVVLAVDGVETKQHLVVENDPRGPAALITEEEDDEGL
jgi:photosystem II stability/assembly factor-like uncharacterized protein